MQRPIDLTGDVQVPIYSSQATNASLKAALSHMVPRYRHAQKSEQPPIRSRTGSTQARPISTGQNMKRKPSTASSSSASYPIDLSPPLTRHVLIPAPTSIKPSKPLISRNAPVRPAPVSRTGQPLNMKREEFPRKPTSKDTPKGREIRTWLGSPGTPQEEIRLEFPPILSIPAPAIPTPSVPKFAAPFDPPAVATRRIINPFIDSSEDEEVVSAKPGKKTGDDLQRSNLRRHPNGHRSLVRKHSAIEISSGSEAEKATKSRKLNRTPAQEPVRRARPKPAVQLNNAATVKVKVPRASPQAGSVPVQRPRNAAVANQTQAGIEARARAIAQAGSIGAQVRPRTESGRKNNARALAAKAPGPLGKRIKTPGGDGETKSQLGAETKSKAIMRWVASVGTPDGADRPGDRGKSKERALVIKEQSRSVSLSSAEAKVVTPDPDPGPGSSRNGKPPQRPWEKGYEAPHTRNRRAKRAIIVSLSAPPADLRRISLRPVQRPDIPMGSKCFLLALPLEVREIIYRNLLQAEGPIQVMNSWSQVYKRHRADLSTSIMLSCRQIFTETQRVLYSENTFSYLLRDKAQVVDLESDRTGGDRIIDIHRYGHFFRNLRLVVEYNRTDKDTGEVMTRTIDILNNLQSGLRLNRLTISISPREDDDEHVSMFQFFHKDGGIIKALRALNINFIELVLHLKEGTAVRTVVDMRFIPREHHGAGLMDDFLVRQARKRLASEAIWALDHLGDRIMSACTCVKRGIDRGWWEEYEPPFEQREEVVDRWPIIKIEGLD